jgi:hypothetical protein
LIGRETYVTARDLEQWFAIGLCYRLRGRRFTDAGHAMEEYKQAGSFPLDDIQRYSFLAMPTLGFFLKEMASNGALDEFLGRTGNPQRLQGIEIPHR